MLKIANLAYNNNYIVFAKLQIVKEYERAVILRLGRLKSHRAKGPGTKQMAFVL